MKKLFFLLAFLPLISGAQSLNYIFYTKAGANISIGYHLQDRDTVLTINKSQSQAYNAAVQVFRMDTIDRVMFQISPEFTGGEPERVLAYKNNNVMIINREDLPAQAGVIYDQFVQEIESFLSINNIR